MNNERIDLTQFEGISPAKGWGLVYPERPQRTSVRTGDGLYHPHCRADDIEVRRANMALMAASPDLLAELKRCYEKIDEVRWMLMQAYDGQKEREREIDYLRSYCLDNGVCPYCGEAQQDPALREHLGILKMCYSCEDKIHFGIEPNDNASE